MVAWRGYASGWVTRVTPFGVTRSVFIPSRVNSSFFWPEVSLLTPSFTQVGTLRSTLYKGCGNIKTATVRRYVLERGLSAQPPRPTQGRRTPSDLAGPYPTSGRAAGAGARPWAAGAHCTGSPGARFWRSICYFGPTRAKLRSQPWGTPPRGGASRVIRPRRARRGRSVRRSGGPGPVPDRFGARGGGRPPSGRAPAPHTRPPHPIGPTGPIPDARTLPALRRGDGMRA